MNVVYLNYNPGLDEAAVTEAFRAVFGQLRECQEALPPVVGQYRFDVLVITEETAEVPGEWEETRMTALGRCKRFALKQVQTPHLNIELEVAYLSL